MYDLEPKFWQELFLMINDLEPKFWQGLFLMIIILLLLLVSFNAVMSKLLKVKKKKFFSYNYVNEKHSKIEWKIRMTFVAALLIGNFVNMTRDPLDWIWFFKPWFLIIGFVVATEVTRAIMEYKYAENHNDYKLTISQLAFFVIIFFALYWTNFLVMG